MAFATIVIGNGQLTMTESQRLSEYDLIRYVQLKMKLKMFKTIEHIQVFDLMHIC